MEVDEKRRRQPYTLLLSKSPLVQIFSRRYILFFSFTNDLADLSHDFACRL